MGVRKKEQLKPGTKKEEKTESVNAATTPWSPRRKRWVWERAAVPTVAYKACGHLEKLPYPRVLCGAKPHSHPRNSFNVVRMLCPPHTFHTTLHMHGLTVSKAHATPINYSTCWFKGHWDVHTRHTLRIRTPSNHLVIQYDTLKAPKLENDQSDKIASNSITIFAGSARFLLSGSHIYMMYFSSWQLWTVAIWLTQWMARLITLLEQHSNRQPPTVVTQATAWWETVFALVRL